MDSAGRPSQRELGLDRLAAHLAVFDPGRERARDRLEDSIGSDLATLLVAALSHRSAGVPLARPLAAAAA
jgi:hypothetical protein